MPTLPSLTLADYRVVLALKLAVAVAAALVLLWDWTAERRGPRWRRAPAPVLAVLAVCALAGWWNFGQLHPGAGALHYHEFFHYYLGSKYFPELGYTRLYDCAAAVDAEQGFRAQAAKRWIRNLETNELRIGSPAVREPGLCQSRFSPERWSSFSHDVRWFRDRLSAEKWAEIAGDHGYNATPLWNVAGYLLSNTGPATGRQIRLLSLIDPVLLLVMWAAIWWAFGWRAACVAAIWWGTNYPARYTFIGGAFLREDWLLLAVAGICLAKRQFMGPSGFAFAWSALLRIFPAFILTGLVAKIVLDSWRNRTLRITSEQWRFAGGAALALVLLLPLSITVGVAGSANASVWNAFAQNSRKHLATPLTNNVGLPAVLSFDPSTRAARIGNYWLDSPWDVWIDAHRAAFDRRLPFFVALAALFSVGLALAVRGRDDWVALTLGVGAIPVFTSLTCYYYGILLAFAFLWPQRRAVGVALTFLAVVTCATPALLSADDDRYTLISAAILAFVATTTLVYARRDRPGPVEVPELPADLARAGTAV